METVPEVARLDPWELCERLPGCVCIVRPGGKIVYANSAWRAALANPQAAAAPQAIGAAIRFDGSGGVREAWDEAWRKAPATEGYEFTQQFRDVSGALRWYHVAARPLGSEPGAQLYVVVLSNIDEGRRSALYMRLLDQATDVFAREPDVDAALAQVARSLVPLVADWFVLHRRTADGEIVARLVVNRDPARTQLLLRTIDLSDSTSDRLVKRALATGEPAVLYEITPEMQAELARDAQHLEAIRELDARSILVVPIFGRIAIWGALQLRSDWTAPRPLADADLLLLRELAKRTASALDQAALLSTAERAADDHRFLSEVGEAMVESLDLGSRLDRLVEAVVPRLADWATVNLLLEDGSIETVAIAHRDPNKRQTADRLRGPYYGNPDAEQGTPLTLRTGRPALFSGAGERFLRKHLRPEVYEDVRELGADSAFVVPLAAHGTMYGTLAAMRSEQERRFAESEMWLIQELARRAATAIANARLYERNANVSKAFQDASLPASLPSIPGASFSAYYVPGRSEAMVGGDWYDAFSIGEGRFVVSIGDVCGSGLSAAVVMGSVRQLIRGAVQLQPDARVILDATDRALRIEYPEAIVTAFVAMLDLNARTIAYASAGHPSPLLCGQARIVGLERPGLPLGLRSAAEPSEGRTSFEDGDLLVLYTDGLSESTRNVLEGERSIRAALERPAVRAAANPARALHDAVISGGAADDVAILTVRLGAPRAPGRS